MFRNRLAFSLPVLHSVSHLAFVMAWIDLFCVDFIAILGDVLFGMAAVFAAWSACSFPSMPLHDLLPIHHTLPLQDMNTPERKEENNTNIHADCAACNKRLFHTFRVMYRQ
jgi:hypothetical protein